MKYKRGGKINLSSFMKATLQIISHKLMSFIKIVSRVFYLRDSQKKLNKIELQIRVCLNYSNYSNIQNVGTE